MKNTIIFFILLCLSCNHSLPPSERFTVDINGVTSRTGCVIETMSISQYNVDHNNLNDIRPNNRNEITRYCCWLKNDSKGSTKISFLNASPNYRWYLCKLDMSILENDSLNGLSEQEKLAYIKREEIIALRDKNYVHRDSFPFIIQRGYVYHMFGLCNIEGSYYFRLDATNKLIVQYQDGGPW
ncbi:MAG TPA: hypothetical protein VIY47_13710 [Ignavibacteriaceae bacterium]